MPVVGAFVWLLCSSCECVLQGQPMWMEHIAGIDVVGMQAAGVTLDDYVFYSCRVSCTFQKMFIPQQQGEPPLCTPSP